jgi:hypothetical protein
MGRPISRSKKRFVVGPDGYAISIADLPVSPPRRWLMRRKAQVVAVVEGGLLTIEQVCVRYVLTREEFLAWQGSVAQFDDQLWPALKSRRQ